MEIGPRFNMSPEIRESFPHQFTGIFGPFDTPSQVATTACIDSLKTAAEKNPDLQQALTEAVSHWKAVYASLKVSPSWKSSIEKIADSYQATGRNRIFDEEKLPLAVTLYNWVSLVHSTPMGGYDWDKLSPPIELVRARKGESFFPIGRALNEEKTIGHEVVYKDQAVVVCRCWNKSDSELTKIAPMSSRLLLIADITATSCEAAQLRASAIASSLEIATGALSWEVF